MNNQLELDLGLPRIKDALTDRQTDSGYHYLKRLKNQKEL